MHMKNRKYSRREQSTARVRTSAAFAGVLVRRFNRIRSEEIAAKRKKHTGRVRMQPKQSKVVFQELRQPQEATMNGGAGYTG